jgi:predicted amidohydrolase YtcJ
MGKVPADQAHSIAELVELIRQRAGQTPHGQWVQKVDAWHESNLAEGRLPTALELDQATQEHPVWVKRGGHIGVANSLALKLAHITRETPDPKGATIKRFPDGTPNGILLEAAAWQLVSNLIPTLSTEQLAENLKQTCQLYNALGIGAVESNPRFSRPSIASICSGEVDRKTRICSLGIQRYSFSTPSTPPSEVSGLDFQRQVAT